MVETKDRKIIIRPEMPRDRLKSFAEMLLKEGVTDIVLDKSMFDGGLDGMTVYSSSEEADVVLVQRIEDLKEISEGKRRAITLKIDDSTDISKVKEASKLGVEAVFVETSDWKIIPLENIIAELHGAKTKVYTTAAELGEVKMLFSVLELGVDGVVLKTDNIEEVRKVKNELSSLTSLDLSIGEVIEVREVGIGERACVDTASLLQDGEGLLVGNQAAFLFLLHNEAVGSKFTSPRPFRVNAGAIQCYTMIPNGRTKYLSELESGDDVLVVSRSGSIRTAVVGRVKIERRPLLLVKAKIDGRIGGILVQNAETIAFVGEGEAAIPATSIKKGDRVAIRTEKILGRHFGMEVDEFVVEK